MNPVVQVSGLNKTYGKFVAVNDVSFDVQEGEIFGILGPNGAGKTTTLEMIEGLTSYQSGSITILGTDLKQNPKSIKNQLGIQLQSSAYFDYLTLQEILTLFSSMYKNSKDPKQLLEQVGLNHKSKSRIKQLSGGETHKFTLAAALINDPKILVLDEPTTALDPKSRREVWALIQSINQKGTTVLITTHYMEEANTLCDKIAIMNHGKIITIDSPANLKQSLNSTNSMILTTQIALEQDKIKHLLAIDPAYEQLEPTVYQLQIGTQAGDFSKALDLLSRHNIEPLKLEIIEPTLEDVFINFTQN
tara:strand:+ start:1984 stop:2895 length:912 start_codon:yes stop_codon:yes gene_type:complete